MTREEFISKNIKSWKGKRTIASRLVECFKKVIMDDDCKENPFEALVDDKRKKRLSGNYDSREFSKFIVNPENPLNDFEYYGEDIKRAIGGYSEKDYDIKQLLSTHYDDKHWGLNKENINYLCAWGVEMVAMKLSDEYEKVLQEERENGTPTR